MSKRLSVIIPSRNERFAVRTAQDILEKATGDIECILVVDGPSEHPIPAEMFSDNRFKVIHFETPIGMRASINIGAIHATGDLIAKSDGHNMFAPGFDKELIRSCGDNVVMVPRRYSLDAEKWEIDHSRPFRDYHYLCYPDPNKKHDGGMHGVEWLERTKERLDIQYELDYTPCFQGSFWCMSREHWDKIGGLKEGQIYGKSGWAQEPTEICLKTWLSGGRIIINKRTWYAHLHKGKTYGRGYDLDDKGVIEGHNWSARHWVNNEEPGMKYKFEWLIDEKFPGMPGWSSDWKEKLRRDGVMR